MTLTRWVMLAIVVIGLVYDGYAIYVGGVQNSISWNVTELSKQFPFIPFAIGVLCGHFFGQMKASNKNADS